MNKENKLMLQELHVAQTKRKYPNMPEYAIPTITLNDNNANGLTKCIIFFLNAMEHQAERISTMGKYVDNRTTFENVLGVKRTIGSGKYIKGQGTVGSADISATIKGKSVKIEVKYGRDKQSDAQKKYQESIERAGGTYIIAKDFDSFYEWYKKYITT